MKVQIGVLNPLSFIWQGVFVFRIIFSVINNISIHMNINILDKIDTFLSEVRIVRFVTLPKDKITKQDIRNLEIILDRMFKSLDIDIEFTHHFIDRVNDKRNGKHITIDELQDVFNKTYNKLGNKLSHMKNIEAVLHDIQNDINVPFVLKYNKNDSILELISKTVMRKKNFKTKNKKYNV